MAESLWPLEFLRSVAGQVIASQWHHGHFLRICLYFWLASMCCALTSRARDRSHFSSMCGLIFAARRNAVIVGGGERACQSMRRTQSACGVELSRAGFCRLDCGRKSRVGMKRVLAGSAISKTFLMREVVDEVIVALSIKSHYSTIERVIAVCERVGVQVQYCEDLFDVSWSGHCHVGDIEQRRIVLKMVREDYRHRIKRVLDIAGALFGLILCLPLFIVVEFLSRPRAKAPSFSSRSAMGSASGSSAFINSGRWSKCGSRTGRTRANEREQRPGLQDLQRSANYSYWPLSAEDIDRRATATVQCSERRDVLCRSAAAEYA